VALGLLVGVVMGLTGAGGGILAVPMLVFGLDLTVSLAGPVGLLAVGTAAAVGAVVGLRARIGRYRAAVRIAGWCQHYSLTLTWRRTPIAGSVFGRRQQREIRAGTRGL
jgi:hypothetical protein